MPVAVTAAEGLPWDRVFLDRSGSTPLHFVARYVDERGTAHRLEEWRAGLEHLRRETDGRLDLHADALPGTAAGQPRSYQWQLLDRDRKIDHRISSAGMLRLGMLYSYYALAHGINRPAGAFQLRAATGMAPTTWHGLEGRWFEIAAAGQPTTRVCWLASAGVPLRLERQKPGGWTTTFALEQLTLGPLSPAVFAVHTQGFQIRDADEAQAAED